MRSPKAPDSAPVSPRRLWLFRIALALVVLVVPLGLLEIGLRLSGYGYDPRFLLPAEVNGKACLVDNPRFGRRFFPERLARVPQPLAVPVPKPADTLRVVVLGESAALGDPEPGYGLPRVLEVLLAERLPGTRVEVVNAAMTAINSHALRDIARDCLALEADAWVVYAGNNEVVGPYGPGTVFGRAGGSLPLIRAGLALRRTRTGQFLDDLAGRWGGASDASPTGWTGLGMFQSRQVPADDPRLDGVRSNFRANLADLLDTARGAGIPVVLGTVACNLRDFAPLSVTNIPAADAIAAEVERRVGASDPAGLDALYLNPDRTAAGGDAGLVFQAAAGLAARGRTNLAVEGWLAARDLDALRFRADTRMVNVIREVADGRGGVRLVDVELALARESGGAPGAALFWEHVHFTFEGNLRLATLLGDAVVASLPEARTRAMRPAWADADTVARALAYTDWDRRRVVQLVRSRVSGPPFSTQINAVEREQWLAGRLQELGPAVQATAFEPAAAAYRAAINARPDDWRLHAHFAGLLAGFRDADGAREEWEAVLAAIPHHLMAHFQLGALLGESATNAPIAETHLRAALAIRPDFAEAWQHLGRALARQELFAEAEEAYLRALDLRPDLTDVRVDRAITHLVAGRTNQSLGILREAVTVDPGHSGAAQVLGRTLMSLGKPAEAAEVWEAVARVRPDNFAARLQLADAWQQAGRLDRSGPHLIAALKMDPDHIQTRFRLAMQYAQADMHAEASEQFREVIRREPRAVTAWLNLGSSLMREQKVPEALTAFEKALEIEPGNGQAQEYARRARALLGPPGR